MVAEEIRAPWLAGARLAGRTAATAWWLGERGRDAARWPRELIRRLPERARRLHETLAGEAPATAETWLDRELANAGPWRCRLVPAGLQVAVLITRLFDLCGGPEAAECLWRAATHSTPLTAEEQSAAASVMGSQAIRWAEVRVAQDGLLRLICHYNGNRAFALWHTVNLPSQGRHVRSNLAILVHELVHVYQYERCGSAYIPEALVAQATAEAYGYGRATGLERDRAAGRCYCHYNREQQAQIVQDYYTLLNMAGGDSEGQTLPQQVLACYEACLAEMQAGTI